MNCTPPKTLGSQVSCIWWDSHKSSCNTSDTKIEFSQMLASKVRKEVWLIFIGLSFLGSIIIFFTEIRWSFTYIYIWWRNSLIDKTFMQFITNFNFVFLHAISLIFTLLAWEPWRYCIPSSPEGIYSSLWALKILYPFISRYIYIYILPCEPWRYCTLSSQGILHWEPWRYCIPSYQGIYTSLGALKILYPFI